ncbi:MAG: hypothetical protein KF884_13020 [Fimbriimonadaceae bacterium]|nr:hypothetical protein [Fimbriimonadaceae bacterium]QYK58460.1 MAG: hypothetical protein KF884_13020 [Fimbriimonadaceae bacterium]
MGTQFRAFASLLHRRDPSVRDGYTAIGCFLAGLIVLGLGVAFQVTQNAVWLSAAAVVAVAAVAMVKRPKRGPDRGDVFENLLRQLASFEAQGTLESRVHPELSAKLERGAAAVLEIETLAKALPDKSLAERCFEASTEALWDSVWAGRHLVRLKGHRVKTFEKKCADESFGVTALANVESLVQEIEALRQGLRPEGLEKTATLTGIQLALEHLDDHLRAEKEERQSAETRL